jgi:hypothetical protein
MAFVPCYGSARGCALKWLRDLGNGKDISRPIQPGVVLVLTAAGRAGREGAGVETSLHEIFVH